MDRGLFMNAKRNSCIIGAISSILLLFLDQLTKYFASTNLKGGNSIILIKDVFQLHYLENRGAAFGMMQGMKILFVIGTVLMLALMIFIYWKSPMDKRYRWARFILILLTSGALGNLTDRLVLDYVVDFFYFELINFPIFNVADIYVTCGMALMILFCFFYYKEEELDELLPFRKAQKKNGK